MNTSFTSLLKNVSLFGFFSLLSRLLGVLRDHLLASRFGAISAIGIYDLDTYYAAFRLPDLIYNVLIFGAVSVIFVPLFSEIYQQQNQKKAWEFANIVLNLSLVTLLVLLGFIFIFAPFLMKFLVPGFSQEKLILSVDLTRIMLISPIFFSIGALAQSIQNVFHTFFYYALAPVIYNLGIILGILLFADGFGVYGVTYGVIIGAFLYMLIQIPKIYALGYRYQWLWDVHRKEVKKLFKLIIPRIFGGAINPLMLLSDTFVASLLTTGSLSIVSYAFNIQSLPMGIIGLSFAIVSYGVLAKLAVQADKSAFLFELGRIFSNLLKFLVPAAIGLFLIRFDLVSIILGGGQFTEFDEYLTAETLGVYCFGIIFSSFIPILTRIFYIFHDTFIPAATGLIALILGFIVSLTFALYFRLGVIGIAVGSLFSVLLQFLVLLRFMSRYLINIRSAFALREYLSYFLSSFAMISSMLFIKGYLPNEPNFQATILRLVILLVVGFISYFGSLSLFYRVLFKNNHIFRV